MDELLAALRYKSEGTDIDFKSAQYRFNGGSEDNKAEILKDILALANAWRDGPGYILLGFRECRPHPAEVVGISESIDDAQLQQFVNSKVKPKLTFRYEEHLYEEKTVGIIIIPKQKRTFYLAHKYGKLKSNVVYVRRGSSTDEAEPPEIAAMMTADSGRAEPQVELSVLTPNNDILPGAFVRNYLQFTEPFPDYENFQRTNNPLEIGSMLHDNKDFWRKYAEYVRVDEGVVEMKFVLLNRSKIQLSNAKLEMHIEPLDSQRYQMLVGSDLPEKPKTQWNILHGNYNVSKIINHQNPSFFVDHTGTTPICHVRFGSLLPGEVGKSTDICALIPLSPGKLRLRYRLLASELAIPQESEQILECNGAIEQLDFEGFQNFIRERISRKPTST